MVPGELHGASGTNILPPTQAVISFVSRSAPASAPSSARATSPRCAWTGPSTSITSPQTASSTRWGGYSLNYFQPYTCAVLGQVRCDNGAVWGLRLARHEEQLNRSHLAHFTFRFSEPFLWIPQQWWYSVFSQSWSTITITITIYQSNKFIEQQSHVIEKQIYLSGVNDL